VKAKEFWGRDWITDLDYTPEELETIVDVALDIKRRFALGEPHETLKGKTLFMLFYNSSLRTRTSFEAGMTQLGGHAQFLSADTVYAPSKVGSATGVYSERVSDAARTLAGMGDGIAIRCYGDPVGWEYGRGNALLREFAEWSSIPIINMECDMYHPCQGMADIMTMREKLGDLRGKKFVMSWAYSPSANKPLSVAQSAITVASKFGMDIVLAHPEGFDVDPHVVSSVQQNVASFGGSFSISHNMAEAFADADVVYPKCWNSLSLMPPVVEKMQLDEMRALIAPHKDWICDQKMMSRAKPNALYMHCMPAQRGLEVTDEVMDGKNSVVFDQAHNRMHVQKAIMALLMA